MNTNVETTDQHGTQNFPFPYVKTFETVTQNKNARNFNKTLETISTKESFSNPSLRWLKMVSF